MTNILDRLTSALSDRYRIEREIGAGGMATVYLAEDLKHDRQVALKVLRPELAATLGTDRFLREIKIAARLHHPHILPLYDSGEAGGFLYYVMPYEQGQSLRDKLAREGELPIHDAVRLLRDILDALRHAHESGVVHRDIKPENVMLSGHHALVTDFGVAKAVSEATGREKLTTAGVALGTPSYMAPEQASADPNIDHRADIYAVGALGYELLAGRPPFTGTTAQMILGAHVTQTPEQVSTHRDTVPPALENIVMKCLEKRPADRWQSAAELLPQLEGLTTPSGGITPTGTQPVLSSGTEAAIRRMNPLRIAGLFGLAAVGALAIVYALVMLLGLPFWVFYTAVGLLLVGLPIMLATGHHERRRVRHKTTATTESSEVGVSRWLTWKRSLIGGVLAFGVLVIVTSAFMGMRAAGIGPAATLISSGALEDQERLVLAEFEDRSGDSVLASAITDLIRVDLDQSPVVRLLQSGEMNMALGRMGLERNTPLSLELASEVAEREGVKAVVTGEINVVGGAYVVSTQVITPANDETLLTLRETARDSTEIVDAVDRLSKNLRQRMGESLRSVRAAPPLAQVRTSSLPALRKFTQGTKAAGRYDRRQAVGLYREAIAIDTMFGHAYSSLAMELRNQGIDRPGQIEALNTARRLSERMTEYERLYLDQTYYYAVGYQPRRVIEIAQRNLARDSTNSVTLSFLGWAYRSLREYQQSARYYRQAIAVDSTAGNEHSLLIVGLMYDGRTEEVLEELQVFARVAPDDVRVPILRSAVAYSRNDYDGAKQELERERDAHPENLNVQITTSNALEALANVRGQLAAARQHGQHEDVSRQSGASAQIIAMLRAAREAAVDLVLKQSEPALALDRVESVMVSESMDAVDPLDRPYLDLALTHAMAGDTTRARELLEDFESVQPADIWTLGQQNSHHQVRGWIAIAEGRGADAIVEFRAADRGACNICRLPDLARAYDLAGQTDSAIAIYDRYLSTPFRNVFEDALNRAPSHRRLAELFESLGDTSSAIQHYNAFVELWNDADAELQSQVSEIRQRIARLIGEGGQ